MYRLRPPVKFWEDIRFERWPEYPQNPLPWCIAPQDLECVAEHAKAEAAKEEEAPLLHGFSPLGSRFVLFQSDCWIRQLSYYTALFD